MPGKKSVAPGTPKPLCRCGCGLRVKQHRHRWILAHYTSVHRSAVNRMRASAFRYRVRRERFRRDVDRLLGETRTMTQADLMDLLALVHERGYQSGYHAAQKKYATASAA